MALKYFFLLSLFSFILNGCASLKFQSEIDDNANVEAVEDDEPLAHLPVGEDPSAKVSDNIAQPYKSPLGEISLDRNKHTEMWIKYFQGRGRKYMEKYLERSARYLPMMQNVLRENGLPEELVYIALIESGFSPVAHSHANAVGYWQFIRDTGKRYGLKLDSYIDERRDPVQSTRAAAAYFKALYDMLGSWHLSMAAYNTGENRVRRLVRKYNTKDFWVLIKKRGLYRETKHYVPKFIAAALIAKNPKDFGFENIDYQPALAYDTITIPHPVSLKVLAAGMGTDLDEMKLLNPKFRGDYVPLYKDGPTTLRVPTGKTPAATATVIAMAEVKTPPVVRADYVYYRVRRGDTLGHIALRHRTSVSKIRQLNRLRSRSFLRIGQRLKVPERGYSQHYVQASNDDVDDSSSSNESQSYHVVRRGENLTLIARKYGVSVQDLRRLNSLGRRSIIRVGQRLIVREDEDQQKTVESSARGSSSHVVTRGDTLTSIAQRYGSSVSDLKRLNSMSSDVVKLGERLKVRGPASAGKYVVNKPYYHVVERGENLSTIAEKYNTSLSQLNRLNRIRKNSVLYVGQKLKISNRTVKHVVRRGETLGLIARKYKVSLGELIHANDIQNRKVVLAGQSLIIPD